MPSVSAGDPLRVLLIEDATSDALLIERTLMRNGFEYVSHRIATEAGLRDALRTFAPGVILSDFTMPGFDGMQALEICHRECPDVPFLFVSGTLGEESAIAALRHGAADYVLKTNLLRLPSAVRRALNDAREHAIREEQARRIAHLTRIHTVLSGVNAVILRTRHRHHVLQEACRVAVELGGFRMAWIAVPDLTGTSIDAATFAGHEAGFLQDVAPFPVGGGSGATAALVNDAMRTALPAVNHDLGAGNDARSNHEHVTRGYHSAAALPFVVDGRAIGILVLYAGERAFFDREEMRLLGDLAGDIGFALDYIDKRERLDHLAYFDALTGLANRDLYRDRLGQQIHGGPEDARPLAIVMFDLERFRDFNDALGRQRGDALLRQFADRLVLITGSHDSVARISSDCFSAIFRDTAGGEIGRMLRDDLLPALTLPFDHAGEAVRIAVRAGIAMHPGDGGDPDTLLRNAEAALGRAKESSAQFMFYAPEMHARVARRLTLEHKLRLALEREEFQLHYQRKVDAVSGRTTGVEALLRWQDPDAGLVAPREFVPVLEETGLIRPVGLWVMHRALADRRSLAARGIVAPRIAINVSPLQLREADFADSVFRALGADIDGDHGLDIEITESVIMDSIEHNIAKLRLIRARGVRIAIDDFGTGYSSLAYISRLPVDTLKIDQSFVRSMLHGMEDRNIVSTIISLAHLLTLDVVAEGVETSAERAMLQSLGCDEIQGFLVSRPVPLDALAADLAAESGRGG